MEAAFLLSEQLRQQLPHLTMTTHCGGGSLKSQMKKADKSHARFAIVIGSNEVATREAVIKPLRADKSSTEIALSEQAIAFDAIADALAPFVNPQDAVEK